MMMQVCKKVLQTLPYAHPQGKALEEGDWLENPDRDLRAGELGIPKRRQEVEKPQGEVTFISRVCQPKRWNGSRSKIAPESEPQRGEREHLKTFPCCPTSKKGATGWEIQGAKRSFKIRMSLSSECVDKRGNGELYIVHECFNEQKMNTEDQMHSPPIHWQNRALSYLLDVAPGRIYS